MASVNRQRGIRWLLEVGERSMQLLSPKSCECRCSSYHQESSCSRAQNHVLFKRWQYCAILVAPGLLVYIAPEYPLDNEKLAPSSTFTTLC